MNLQTIRKRIRRFARAFRVSRSVRLMIWIPLLFLLLLVFIWGTEAAEPQHILVDGTTALHAVDIQQTVRETISAPLLGPWFPGNTVAFPASRIVETLSVTYPRIAAASVSRDIYTRTVHVALTERETFAIYCTASPENDTEAMPEIIELGAFPSLRTEACFLMDRSGVVFADAPQTEGSLIMTLVDAESGEVFAGSVVIEGELLDEIVVTWETFTRGINVRPRRILKRPGHIITIETFEGWEAVLSRVHPLESQVLALRELLAKELTVPERRTIDIIDLRVPGRIYYR